MISRRFTPARSLSPRLIVDFTLLRLFSVLSSIIVGERARRPAQQWRIARKVAAGAANAQMQAQLHSLRKAQPAFVRLRDEERGLVAIQHGPAPGLIQLCSRQAQIGRASCRERVCQYV